MRSLGQDITRYLVHEPILARPLSRLYRLRKLVRRNRLASGAIAASVLALVAGFTASSFLYLKADAAEKKQAELRAAAEASEQKQAQLRAEAEERAYVSKAAILLMQNKTAEGGRRDSTHGWHAHAAFRRSHQRLPEIGDLERVTGGLEGGIPSVSWRFPRVNRFDETDMSDNASRDLVPIAPTLVEAGDLDSLKQFEELLLDRMGRTNNPVAAEQILKISLLVPPSNEILKRLGPVAAVAETSVSGRDPARFNWLQAWRCFAVGLWRYRIGDHAGAVRLLTMSMNAPKNDKVVNACCLTIRSKAFRELGQTQESAKDFAEAQAMIDSKFAKPLELDNEGLWYDWLSARILLREASPK